jgi:hypothetical protein
MNKNKDNHNKLLIKIFIISGLLSGLFFNIAWLIQGFFRKGYNHLTDPISALVFGSSGWIQIVNFFITAILLLLFAYGLWKIHKYEKFSKWAVVLIVSCGIGLLGAGLFPTDPLNGYPQGTPVYNPEMSFNGFMHQLFTDFFFIGLPLACFTFGKYFMNESKRPWCFYSLISGILFLLFFILTNLGFSQFLGLQYFAGLIQRITFIIGFLWIFMISKHFLERI